jgi:hypothetical protein
LEEEDLYYRKYYKNKNNKLPQWNNIRIYSGSPGADETKKKKDTKKRKRKKRATKKQQSSSSLTRTGTHC